MIYIKILSCLSLSFLISIFIGKISNSRKEYANGKTRVLTFDCTDVIVLSFDGTNLFDDFHISKKFEKLDSCFWSRN